MRKYVIAAIVGLVTAGAVALAPSLALAQDSDDGMDDNFCLSGWHAVAYVSFELNYVAVEDTCDDGGGRVNGSYIYDLPPPPPHR
jgi:hypothetical protein